MRQELGLDPMEDLRPPLAAAAYSFTTFAVGCAAGWGRGVLGFVSGSSPPRSGLRRAHRAAAAAGVTFGLGRLVGANLG